MNKITRKRPNYKTIQLIGYITKLKCIGYYEKMFNIGRNVINSYIHYLHKCTKGQQLKRESFYDKR